MNRKAKWQQPLTTLALHGYVRVWERAITQNHQFVYMDLKRNDEHTHTHYFMKSMCVLVHLCIAFKIITIKSLSVREREEEFEIHFSNHIKWVGSACTNPNFTTTMLQYIVTIAIQLLFEYVIGNSKLYDFGVADAFFPGFSWRRRSEAKFLLIKSKIFCKQKSTRKFTYNKIRIIQPTHIIITHHFISCVCAYAFSPAILQVLAFIFTWRNSDKL